MLGFKPDSWYVGVELVCTEVIHPAAITLSICSVLAFSDLAANPSREWNGEKKKGCGNCHKFTYNIDVLQ